MSYQATMNAELDKMRANGLSIDGDNAYKRDLLDAVTGALAFGKQRSAPPPAGHWLEPFYEMGKAEADERDAARSLPVGVPDGYALVPVEPTPAMLRAGVHQAVGALPIYRAMLAAAPTVKAEQVQCSTCNDTALIGDLPIECPDCCREEAPSLPAAGSAELEEAAGILRNMIDSIDVHGNYSKESTLLFLNQALSSITAALSAQQSDGVDFGFDDRSVRVSQEAYAIFLDREQQLRDDVAALEGQLAAQQSAPERVSVPVELLGRLETWVTDDCSALEELRALLASHAEGGKV